MYLPVSLFFLVWFGLLAFESRGDDFGSPAWMQSGNNVFDERGGLLFPKGISKSETNILGEAHKGGYVGNIETLILSVPLDSSSATRVAVRQRVIDRAHELIGIPYKWGGMSINGFDCSGLLVYLFRNEAGMELPRTTTKMVRENYLRVSRHELQPGDAVFFNQNGRGPVSHVGLYIGDNKFIHAPRTGKTIRIDSLASSYWSNRYHGARRFDYQSSI